MRFVPLSPELLPMIPSDRRWSGYGSAQEEPAVGRAVCAPAAWAPAADRAAIWRRVRLAVELGYAVDEMLHEEDRVAREDLFADAARAIQAIFAEPEGER